MLQSSTQVAFRLFGQLAAALMGAVALVVRGLLWLTGGSRKSTRTAPPRDDAEILEDIEFVDDDEPDDTAPADDEAPDEVTAA